MQHSRDLLQVQVLDMGQLEANIHVVLADRKQALAGVPLAQRSRGQDESEADGGAVQHSTLSRSGHMVGEPGTEHIAACEALRFLRPYPRWHRAHHPG